MLVPGPHAKRACGGAEKLPNLGQMPFHQFLDGERPFALLRPVHPGIMMRVRFEIADRAGQVSWLALCSVSGGLRGARAGSAVDVCALDQGVVEAKLIKLGHSLFGVIKSLFLSAVQKLRTLRI